MSNYYSGGTQDRTGTKMPSQGPSMGDIPLHFTMKDGAFLPPEVLEMIEKEIRQMSAGKECCTAELKVIVQEQTAPPAKLIDPSPPGRKSEDDSDGISSRVRPRRSVVKPQRFRDSAKTIECHSGIENGRIKKLSVEDTLVENSSTCRQESKNVRKRHQPRKSDTPADQKIVEISSPKVEDVESTSSHVASDLLTTVTTPIKRKRGRPSVNIISAKSTNSNISTEQEISSPRSKRGRPRKDLVLLPNSNDAIDQDESPGKRTRKISTDAQSGHSRKLTLLESSTGEPGNTKQSNSHSTPKSELLVPRDQSSNTMNTAAPRRGRSRQVPDATIRKVISTAEIHTTAASDGGQTDITMALDGGDLRISTCDEVPDSDDDSRMKNGDSESGKVQKELAESNEVTLLMRGKTAVQCNLCYKVFDSKITRRDHQVTCTVPCEHCGKMFDKRYELTRHKKSKLGCGAAKSKLMEKRGKATFSCEICSVVLTSKVALNRHVEVHHENRLPLEEMCCDLCKSQFRTKIGLEKHKVVCSQLTCKYCNEHFKQPYLLQRHAGKGVCRTLRRRQRQTECDICGKIVKDYRKLTEHRRGHQTTEDFECDLCCRRFKSALRLSYHVRVSHFRSRSVLCTLCGASFQNAEGLNYHMKTHMETALKDEYTETVRKLDGQGFKSKLIVAPASNMFSCFICSAALSKIFDWFYHIQLHIKSEDEDSEVPQELLILARTLSSKHQEEFNKRAYPCTVCQRVYYKRSQLIQHKKNHELLGHDLKSSNLANRPHLPPLYECNVCPSKFRSEASLRVHKQYHTEIFDFTCEDCGEGFPLKHKLNIHLYQVHGKRGKGVLICPKCDMVILSRTTLLKHMKVVHENHRPFECNTCKKSFGTKYALDIHSQIHSGQKPHKCQVCQKLFRDRANLLHHNRRCHPHINISFRSQTLIKKSGKSQKKQTAKWSQRSNMFKDQTDDNRGVPIQETSGEGTTDQPVKRKTSKNTRKPGAILKLHNSQHNNLSMPFVESRENNIASDGIPTTSGDAVSFDSNCPMVVASTEDVHTENLDTTAEMNNQVQRGAVPSNQEHSDETAVFKALLIPDQSEEKFQNPIEYVKATYLLQQDAETSREGVEIHTGSGIVSSLSESTNNTGSELAQVEAPEDYRQIVYSTSDSQVLGASCDDNETYIVLDVGNEFVEVGNLGEQVVEVYLKTEEEAG